MAEPKETVLYYVYMGNNAFTLSVPPTGSAIYIWQKCKIRTTQWETILSTTSNAVSITINPTSDIGTKYRCLVTVNKAVILYSRSLLISKDKMIEKSNSYSQNSYSKYYSGYNYNKDPYSNTHTNTNANYEPSVADTDGMDGLKFEKYCADILRKNGFSNVVVTQGSGDYGVDITAQKDLITYAIQCKSYSGTVGIDAVQEVYSGKAKYKCTVAVVLTNNYFTKAAHETAKYNSVILWDRDYLNNMIKTAYSTQSNQSWQGNKNAENQQNHNQSKTNDGHHNKDNSTGYKQKEKYSTNSTTFEYFKGCTNWEQIRERYRGLMKLYHPDSGSGDMDISQEINAQYEKLKEKYSQ